MSCDFCQWNKTFFPLKVKLGFIERNQKLCISGQKTYFSGLITKKIHFRQLQFGFVGDDYFLQYVKKVNEK